MVPFYIFLLASCLTFVVSDDVKLSEEDRKAIEDRLDKLQAIKDFVGLLFFGEERPEAREEKCIPIGHGCKFGSGPNCCGLRTRCFIWDRTVGADKAGNAIWVSACREYRLGVWLDEIGKFFSSLV